MISRPKHAGLRHVAINVLDLQKIKDFYIDLLGFELEWQPDQNDLYLSSGNDNLAFHRVSDTGGKAQKLDHIGIIIDDINQVDNWYQYLKEHEVKMASEPKTHRDGARSFYCYDPEDNVVQVIFHPPISKGSVG